MKIIHRRLALALALLMLLAAAGCGASNNAQSPADDQPPTDALPPADVLPSTDEPSPDGETDGEAAFPYTFTDSTGREITLPAAPERVAVLMSSYAEVWQLAGGTVDITVGETVERGFAGEDALLVDDVSGKSIDVELLLSYEPDLVIGSADIQAQADACTLLAEAGVPAALFRVDVLEDYLAMLKVCTSITGDGAAYETCGQEVADRAASILDQAEDYLARSGGEAPRILFIRAASSYSATKAKRAPDNFVCVMLDQLGAYNIADNAPLLLDGLSLEEVLREDPDYIFLTTMGSEDAARSYIAELFAQDGWKDLSAVAEGRYSFLPKDMFHFKPNGRWAEAYAYLAQLLYPDLALHD